MLITVILVLVTGVVSYIAPVPSAMLTCDAGMLDNIAAYVPPHYGSFTDLMQVEAGSPAVMALVITPDCTVVR